MRSFISVSNFAYNIEEALNNATKVVALGTDMVFAMPGMYKTSCSLYVRELIFVYNTLSKMTSKPEIDADTLGIGRDGADTAEFKPGLFSQQEANWRAPAFKFVLGAVNDPFLRSVDQPGQEGFQEASVMGLEKARHLIGALLEGVIVGAKLI